MKQRDLKIVLQWLSLYRVSAMLLRYGVSMSLKTKRNEFLKINFKTITGDKFLTSACLCDYELQSQCACVYVILLM